MGRWVNCRGNIFPFLGMVMAMLAQSGSMVVIKVAMTDGINKYVMVVYSLALSTILLLPFALFLHRFSFLFSLFSSSFYLLHYMEGNVSSLFERTKFNRNIFWYNSPFSFAGQSVLLLHSLHFAVSSCLHSLGWYYFYHYYIMMLPFALAS